VILTVDELSNACCTARVHSSLGNILYSSSWKIERRVLRAEAL